MYNDDRKMKEDRRNGFNHAHCGRTQPITLGMWVGIRKKLRSLHSIIILPCGMCGVVMDL